MEYNELKDLHTKYFSIGCLGTNFSERLAVVSCLAYIVSKLKEKNPDTTYYQVLYKIAGTKLPEDLIKALAIVCEDFAYNCDSFPTFDIKPKEMPDFIKKVLHKWTPF